MKPKTKKDWPLVIIWAAVPEPSNLLLLGSGLAGLGFFRRRRKAA